MGRFGTLQVFCLFVLVGVLIDGITGKPNLIRRKRIIGQIDSENSPSFYDEDDGDDDDADGERYERRAFARTYPPFPSDEDDGYEWWKDERVTEPTTTTTTTTTTEATPYIEETTAYEDPEEPFHKKASSWFRRQWGKAKQWGKSVGKDLQKHYETISERVG